MDYEELIEIGMEDLEGPGMHRDDLDTMNNASLMLEDGAIEPWEEGLIIGFVDT